MVRHIAQLVFVLWSSVQFGSSLEAQPRPGDFVAGGLRGLVSIARTSGRLTTISGTQLTELLVLPSQREVVGTNVARQRVERVDLATGVSTTLATLGPNHTNLGGVALDQDGSLLFAADTDLFRLRGSVPTLIATVPPVSVAISGILRDIDTGDYLAVGVMLGAPFLYRVDRATKTVTTVSTVGFATLADQDQRTGNVWVTQHFSAWGDPLLEIDPRQGRVLTSIALPGKGYAVVDQPTSDMFVAAHDRIYRYTPSGTPVRTWGPYYGRYFFDLRVVGARRLSGSGAARPGATYALSLRFLGLPPVPYSVALSFGGARPGIPIPGTGQRVNIAVDALFLLTASGALPGLTSGFSGTLDANGDASAAFRIPSGIPLGVVFTAAAVAFDPASPGGVSIAPSISVVVE